MWKILLESKLVGKNWKVTGSYYVNSGQSGRGPSNLSKTFNTKRFFGIVNPQDGNAYSALVTASPAQDAFFALYQYSVGGNNPGVQDYIVTIDYDVEFRDPKQLSGS